MSLIPSFMNNPMTTSLFGDPMWNWRSMMTPLSLDLFDPFDDLDREMSRNFHWFSKPEFMGEPLLGFPRVPHKYRVTVDCTGFTPSSIKTEISEKDKKLTVSAHEESKEGGEDYCIKKLKKTYQLPPNSITGQMISFMSNNGQLVVEVPLMETEMQKVTGLFPQIVDAKEGGVGKEVVMKYNLPENIDPSKVNVSVKGHDIILRAEDQLKRPDGISRVHYYQRTTFPEHAQLDSLKCVQENNQVIMTAPIVPGIKETYRKVPIEYRGTQPQIKSAK